MPTATCLVIEDGRIKAVGGKELEQEYRGGGQLFDAGTRAVIPGLTDAHLHLEQYALGLQKVDCETATKGECLARVARRAHQLPPGKWILGHGWNQNDWSEGYGNAAELDQVAPDQPVFLTAKSLHAAWVNSAALRLANLTADTPDPSGGRLGRDAHGNLSGILYERAMELVYTVIPEPSQEQVCTAIQQAQLGLWKMGLTGVHDFDRRRCFMALQKLHQNNELYLRVLKSIPFEDLPHAVALGLRTGFGDDVLRIGQVKAFADGALGPQTAAMLQPYDNQVENSGILMMDVEELYELGRMAVDAGLALAVHAIGDRANHEVLQAFEQLREYEYEIARRKGQQVSHKQLRHRIEHVQLIHPDDANRLAKLDIIASMQPIHAPSDMLMADRFWGKRATFAYAWRTQLKSGAVLAFGSDAPVESPNPFWGVQAAVTRRRLDGTPGPDGWYPEQRLSIDQAIHAFTSGAAYAAGMEDRLGKIAPGYLADLLILDRDPFACPPDELHRIRPTATMVDGHWVYGE